MSAIRILVLFILLYGNSLWGMWSSTQEWYDALLRTKSEQLSESLTLNGTSVRRLCSRNGECPSVQKYQQAITKLVKQHAGTLLEKEVPTLVQEVKKRSGNGTKNFNVNDPHVLELAKMFFCVRYARVVDTKNSELLASILDQKAQLNNKEKLFLAAYDYYWCQLSYLRGASIPGWGGPPWQVIYLSDDTQGKLRQYVGQVVDATSTQKVYDEVKKRLVELLQERNGQ